MAIQVTIRGNEGNYQIFVNGRYVVSLLKATREEIVKVLSVLGYPVEMVYI